MNKVDFASTEQQKKYQDICVAHLPKLSQSISASNWKRLIETQTPFCLLATSIKDARFIEGDIVEHDSIPELEQYLQFKDGESSKVSAVSLLPFSAMKERGFEVYDAGEKILTLVPKESFNIDLSEFSSECENTGFQLIESTPEVSDQGFIEMVAGVINNEIKKGEGSNFLVSRRTLGKANPPSRLDVLQVFNRLLTSEFGSFLTFCFFDGKRYYIGASPEQHIGIIKNKVSMRPICGTLPKKVLDGSKSLIEFATDQKEVNELFQVVDETLKMMAKICEDGGVVKGPFFKEMSSLIHTEYSLEGEASVPILEALTYSLFPPTMVGSPLENAARIIKKYEPSSRGYYSSSLVLTGSDIDGSPFLDSAITIRTLEIGVDGDFSFQVGASIVRDSIPEKELLEINAKSKGMLTAAFGEAKNQFSSSPILQELVTDEVYEALVSRNKTTSTFWMNEQSKLYRAFDGVKVLLVDNEDEFTFMIRHLLNHLGCSVQLFRVEDISTDMLDSVDVVLLGPGPGDPRDLGNERIKKAHEICNYTLKNSKKLLGVCLGHQILSYTLGIPLILVDPPLQGVQKEVDLFGTKFRVGFYNTFFGKPENKILPDGIVGAFDGEGRLLALKGRGFYSVQFHLESVLTTENLKLLGDAMSYLGEATV